LRKNSDFGWSSRFSAAFMHCLEYARHLPEFFRKLFSAVPKEKP